MTSEWHHCEQWGLSLTRSLCACWRFWARFGFSSSVANLDVPSCRRHADSSALSLMHTHTHHIISYHRCNTGPLSAVLDSVSGCCHLKRSLTAPERCECFHVKLHPMFSSDGVQDYTAEPTKWLAETRNSSRSDIPKHKQTKTEPVWSIIFIRCVLGCDQTCVMWLTRATCIQCSRIRALWAALSVRSLRQVEMTQFVTRLNCVTVALMVGARCSFPFLSLWDQMLPRQWYGTTRLNSSCLTRTQTAHM